MAGFAKKPYRFKRKGNSNASTFCHLKNLLPSVLDHIENRRIEGGNVVVITWPKVVGKRLSSMTEALYFEEGVLFVKVKNSSLYSLLVEHEKQRLLNELKARLPKIKICNIRFKMG